ncbi:MAG: DnaD domain protein [Oscillospiraceae bacterium]|nr:DnaD domain protein [Oscillospiraceae bacterium]
MLSLSGKYDLSSFPVSFIERYRAADGPALKVALYLLFGNSADAAQIAAELSLPPSTVERSLNFWLLAGLLTESLPVADLSAKPAKPKVIQAERRIPVTEMAKRLRNPEIAALLQESQSYLGRTLTQNESERLLCIYEYDELPVDVILMIVAYSKNKAKRNLIGYIERVAREWKEDEIDTGEKAENHLALLAQRERRYKKIAELLEIDESVFKYKDRQYIDFWFEELGYDAAFAEEAYLRQGNKSIAYINKIMRSWAEKGYKTIKETRSEVSNTAAPAPNRKSKRKADLFGLAVKETNTGKAVD